MTTFLFARHGNTFDPGDKVVWVGRETDLPLVAKGIEQARNLAKALPRPDIIYCASLKRTRATAEIVADHFDLPAPLVDSRLDELDYGDWAGRSNEEILAATPHAADEMAAWNQLDRWPERAGWGSRRDDVMACLRDFAADRMGETAPARVLTVSSNGILRFLPRLILAQADQLASFKMRTGHLGIIALQQGKARLLGWDLPPDASEYFGVQG